MVRAERKGRESPPPELQHGTGRSRQKDDRMKRIVKKHPPAGKAVPEGVEPGGEKR